MSLVAADTAINSVLMLLSLSLSDETVLRVCRRNSPFLYVW